MKALNLTGLSNRIRRIFNYGDAIRPQRDWLVIIGVGSILLLASAGWSYSVFHRVNIGESLEAPDVTSGLTLSSLEAVRTIFDMRAAERAHYQNDYRFVDPSR